MIVGQYTLYGKAGRVYIKTDSPRANLDQHVLPITYPLGPGHREKETVGMARISLAVNDKARVANPEPSTRSCTSYVTIWF